MWPTGKLSTHQAAGLRPSHQLPEDVFTGKVGDTLVTWKELAKEELTERLVHLLTAAT